MTDEKRPIAKKEAPKEARQDAPLTQEMFAAQMQRLAERARKAGLNPLKTMAQTYANRGMDIIDGLLEALDTGASQKKKRKK